MARPTITDNELAIDTPEITALRLTVAQASDAERPAAQAALDAAISARVETVLDTVTDRLLAQAAIIERWIFDERIEHAADEMRMLADYLVAHHSITRHPTSRREIPLGELMSSACRRRGPLVRLSRALADLIPTRALMEFSRDRDVVIAAREARRKEQTEDASK